MEFQTNPQLVLRNGLSRRSSDAGKDATVSSSSSPPSPEKRTTRWMNGVAGCGCAYQPTGVEHVANIISHAIWILPSTHFLVNMVHKSASPRQELAAWAYGIALIMLFFVSTTFHVVSWMGNMPRLKEFFHRGDRAMIYVFIAASYFPWLTLPPLPDGTWTSETLPVAIWVFACIGILYQQIFHEQYKWLEIIIYVFVGGIPSVTIAMEANEVAGVDELCFGGLVYLVGVIFFKSDGRIPFAHAIWHLHVIGGCSLHYSAICRHLLGPENVHPPIA